MKKILLLTLAVCGFSATAQTTYKADIYTGRIPGSAVTYRAQNATTGASGDVTVRGSDTADVAQFGGNVVLRAGTGGLGDGVIQAVNEFRFGTVGNFVGFNVSAPVSYSVTLPSAAPATGEALVATSATTLDWVAVGAEAFQVLPLTADNQVVAPSGFGSILLLSDDATPANRTFTIGARTANQTITFIWGNTNGGELLDGSATSGGGTLFLNGDWLPQNGDTIVLRCPITTGNCYEVSRSDNF